MRHFLKAAVVLAMAMLLLAVVSSGTPVLAQQPKGPAIGHDRPTKPPLDVRRPKPPAPPAKHGEGPGKVPPKVPPHATPGSPAIERIKEFVKAHAGPWRELGKSVYDVAVAALSGNEPHLLSENRAALLSGNSPKLLSEISPNLLSGNKPEVLSGNKALLFSGNCVSILSNIKIEFCISGNGNGNHANAGGVSGPPPRLDSRPGPGMPGNQGPGPQPGMGMPGNARESGARSAAGNGSARNARESGARSEPGNGDAGSQSAAGNEKCPGCPGCPGIRALARSREWECPGCPGIRGRVRNNRLVVRSKGPAVLGHVRGRVTSISPARSVLGGLGWL